MINLPNPAHSLVYLYFALALATPGSLYGAIPAILVLWGLVRCERWLWQERVCWLFWGYALVHSALLVIHGDSASSFDGVLRFWLIPFAMIILCRQMPPLHTTALAAAIGCFAALALAVWQVFIAQLERAEGFLHVIQFGNLVLLQGLLCLTLAVCLPKSRLLLLAAFIAALLASLLSGSRGGWVALLPVALLLWLLPARRRLPRHFARYCLAATLAAMALVLLTPIDDKIHVRLAAAWHDIALYRGGEVNTSLGLRFEMWRSAWDMLQAHPWVGVGHQGVHQWLLDGIARGTLHPALAEFRHLHNDFIDAFARGGILGGTSLLALFAGLAWHYARHWRRTRSPYALLGLVILTAFVAFAMSQSVLRHNSGVMVFLFLNLWCVAGCRQTA